MSTDLERLRTAAVHARNLGDWLEATARRAGYTTRGVDLERAHRVADTILGTNPPVPVETEPARGFRVGDLVQITGRGVHYDGKTGIVTGTDDDGEYPISLTVEGFAGPVWCNPSEIRRVTP